MFTKTVKVILGAVFSILIIIVLAAGGFFTYRAYVPAEMQASVNEKIAVAQAEVDRLRTATKPNTSSLYPSVDAKVAPVVTNCKMVNFTRADVGSNKNFTLTFKDGDLSAFQGCNPGAQIDKTANGVRIVVAYGDGGANVKIPASLTEGNVHNARCVPGNDGNPADATLYKAVWSGEAPSAMELKKVDKAFYNATAALSTCQKLADRGKYH